MMIDFDIENELRPNLAKDEKLIWTDRPETGIKLQASDAFMIPFSLLWGAFAIFWESSVITTSAPFLFKLWGIPFVLVGLYMIIGRFFAEARKRQNTVYGLTDNRIIIKSGIFSQEIKSLNLKTLSDITISEKNNGSGSIMLGPIDPRYAMMGNMTWPGVKQQPQLQFIQNVQDVYQLILKLQNSKL